MRRETCCRTRIAFGEIGDLQEEARPDRFGPGELLPESEKKRLCAGDGAVCGLTDERGQRLKAASFFLPLMLYWNCRERTVRGKGNSLCCRSVREAKRRL